MYIIDDGKYIEISIMDIYTIMDNYNECSKSLTDNHNIYKCICTQKFNENIDNDNNIEIKNSIINHYEKTQQVKLIYNNLKNYIYERYNDSSEFIYNISKIVKFKENNNFKFYNKFSLIANSDKYILYFVLKPQYNKLNFNEVIIDILFNNFLINNIDSNQEEDYKRYGNKKIITCILTLDSEFPVFYEIDNQIDNKYIIDTMKEFLLNKYSETHEDMFKFYNYCKEKKGNKDSITFTYDEISRKNKENPTIPKYIELFFYDLKKEIEKAKKDKISNDDINNLLMRVNNKEIFLIEMKNYLQSAINEFLDVEQNNNIENDY